MNETFNHGDIPDMIERLSRLCGQTTYREPGTGGGGGSPGRVPHEHGMVLALALARRHEKDWGPDLAYSIATGRPHRRDEIVQWLADKLGQGTGGVGRKNPDLLLPSAGMAYQIVLGNDVRAPKVPRRNAIEMMANIGAAWLWVVMEAAVERAETALHGA